MSSRPPGWPMRSSTSPTAAWTTCGRRTVEVSQACRHVAGGEAAQPPCTFSPERRGVFQPLFRWRHGDEASPCRHPGGTMPPLPWSERRYMAVRSLQGAIPPRLSAPVPGWLPVAYWPFQGFLLKRRQISHRQISIQLGKFLGNFSPLHPMLQVRRHPHPA